MEHSQKNEGIVFDHAKLQKQGKIPSEFIWPNLEFAQDELNEPLIDLQGFISGDERATAGAIKLVRGACMSHGFFQVINHGVDASLIAEACEEFDSIFKLPIEKKLSITRKPGSIEGYSGAHAQRFAANLPWKETFSFGFHENGAEPVVVEYFKSLIGQEFERIGWVFQKYCQAMKKLSGVIFELLAVSLGVDRKIFKKFYEDGNSLVRCNYYPPCTNSDLTIGTGPHCDATSVTILHQDQVGGLEVFSNSNWYALRPRPGALVINIGDTFMALTNGKYKSCLHRAMVNGEKERKSLVFFVNPKSEKVVRAPEELISKEESRLYPDFTWSDLLAFTQQHYRSDVATLQRYIDWVRLQKNF